MSNLLYNIAEKFFEDTSLADTHTDVEVDVIRKMKENNHDRAKFIIQDIPYSEVFHFGSELINNGLINLPHEKSFFQMEYKGRDDRWLYFCDQKTVTVPVNDTFIDMPVIDVFYFGMKPGDYCCWPVIRWYLINNIAYNVPLNMHHAMWLNKVYINDDMLSDIISRLVCIIAFLNCKGIEEKVVDPTNKNNKRIKMGKKILHKYTIIRIDPKFKTSKSNGGGLHNSPRPHWRRGHIRTLSDNRKVIVRPHPVMGMPPKPPTYIVK